MLKAPPGIQQRDQAQGVEKSVSGRPHASVIHPSSATDLVRFGPSARHDLPSVAADAALWFGLDDAWLAARAGSAVFVAANSRFSSAFLVCAYWKEPTHPRNTGFSVSMVCVRLLPRPRPKLTFAGFAARYAAGPGAGPSGYIPRTCALTAWRRHFWPR